jgi:uncharacterized membrane protein YfcA
MIAADVLMLAAAIAAAGVAAGLLAGLLGVGGGIVIVPTLEFAFAMFGVPPEVRMHLAVGTSLASIIPTAISSSKAHRRLGAVDDAIARRWAPAIAAGSATGAVVAAMVRGSVLSAVFGTVAVTVAAKMLLPLDGRRVVDDVPRSRWTLLVPGAIGMISSMMGIGGGSLSVPALTLMGQPIHRAVGTSAWLGLWIALPAAIGFVIAGWGAAGLPAFSAGYVNLLAVAVLLPATMLAAPFGARAAHRLPRRILSASFGGFLLVVGGRMLYRAIVG